MQAFNDLRSAARDRRDKLIHKARDEYETTLKQMARLEQDLLVKEPTNRNSIASCITSVIPSDRPFTCNDVLTALEALDPRRPWRMRSIHHTISRLRERGLVRRLATAKPSGTTISSPHESQM